MTQTTYSGTSIRNRKDRWEVGTKRSKKRKTKIDGPYLVRDGATGTTDDMLRASELSV